LNERYVLDSYAILALLNDEPGGPRVEQLLHQAEAGQAQVYMSLINFGEVLYVLERRWGNEQLRSMLAYLDATTLKWIDADRARVLEVAHIKATYPLSYADAFCVSVATEFGATIITGDPEFRPLVDLVEIEWLPQKANQLQE
jgi:ribonuclease VapC